jgi:trehalose 6-phosphate phosphatase
LGKDLAVTNPIDEAVAALRLSPRCSLIALDFDGTLASIVPRPEQARPKDGVLESLRILAQQGAHIVIVTGREATTVLELSGFDTIPELIVIGLHGMQRWHAGELDSRAAPIGLDRLRDDLARAVESVPRMWIEDKGLSLVVHARGCADPDTALDAVRGEVTERATAAGFDVHAGRAIIEIRPPGFDKGTALRNLVEEFSPERVIYAGDDIGDLPAFAVVAQLRAAGRQAWSIAVASAEQPGLGHHADIVVADPAALAEILAEAAGQR